LLQVVAEQRFTLPEAISPMEDQLGLSLASEKVSEEVIVIDPVERPSEN